MHTGFQLVPKSVTLDELPYSMVYCTFAVARETCAPNELHRTLSDQTGYISSPGPSAVAAGSARCPWKISVDRRQGIRVVLYTFSERRGAAVGECPVSAVFDGRVEKTLCSQRSHNVRQRLLHTTDNNELSITFQTTHGGPSSRQMNFYLLHYEGRLSLGNCC